MISFALFQFINDYSSFVRLLFIYFANCDKLKSAKLIEYNKTSIIYQGNSVLFVVHTICIYVISVIGVLSSVSEFWVASASVSFGVTSDTLSFATVSLFASSALLSDSDARCVEFFSLFIDR